MKLETKTQNPWSSAILTSNEAWVNIELGHLPIKKLEQIIPITSLI
jgi:hypothetical protein